MPESPAAKKFYDHYESYQSAKSRKDALWTKLCAMWAVGDVHELVGENYKDKNECAKVITKLFGIIGMTHHQAVETYQELYDDSRPTQLPGSFSVTLVRHATAAASQEATHAARALSPGHLVLRQAWGRAFPKVMLAEGPTNALIFDLCAVNNRGERQTDSF